MLTQLTPALWDEIAALPEGERGLYLFLEPHKQYDGHFKVNCFDDFFLKDFIDLIGAYRALNVLRLPKLLEHADSRGYHVVCLDDPEALLGRLAALLEPYPYDLNLNLKKFQVEGFNWLKQNQADIVDWSTGTGKSVFGCAKAKYLLATGQVDRVVVVAKGHNRIGWARQLRAVANLECQIIGFQEKEPGVWKQRSGAEHREAQYHSPVWVTNYEKFRVDYEWVMKALRNKRVYFIWDEMPSKLKGHTSQLYKSTQAVVRKTKFAWHSCLSATSVENIPEDVYWCIKLMLGKNTPLQTSVSDFRKEYAKSFDFFNPTRVKVWDMTRLQEMGIRIASMTHQANKYRDPEIRAEFPEEHWETIYIDMSSQDRKLYTALKKDIESEFWEGEMSTEIFTRLATLQLACNNPMYLGQGELATKVIEATELTDKYCAKLQTLKDLLGQLDGKVVLFSHFRSFGSNWLVKKVREWGHQAVLYDGNPTHMQGVLDRFKSDPGIKVFVSSDMGSDSINLEEAVNVINYDLPWKYSTLLQRVNRISRITSKGIGVDHVFFYTLLNTNTIEERKEVILERKRAYAEAIFGGAVAEQAEEISALNRNDLWFILHGDDE